MTDFRRSIALVLTLFALTIGASAQPQIAYIIPDIGAQGMNIYVEIIAPQSANGTFGSSGLRANIPGDPVRVEPANSADASKIMVGPIVVSWSGRLISTQIFVKPSAPNGIVPLKVTTSSGSATVDFEIVTPQTLGTGGVLSTPGALGSGGAYGARSKRGAMIVNDLTLQGISPYTVSTNDPDGATQGNQGYLPFILLVKGKATINAPISVSTTGIDGGPGGGGGGGQVCDAAFLGGGSSGTNGGAGYTGGGGGGKNNSFGSHTYNSPGISTGTSTVTSSLAVSYSLNGARGGDGAMSSCGGPENGGGGTGHPFGVGGQMYCGGNPSGGYGGGGGGGQTQTGGGGGYGTDGSNGSSSSNNYGRKHGNAEGVPVAGGSGGASGNPQGLGSCAGGGGGGGGALVVYSTEALTNNVTVEAKGANGGGSPAGGSGSGGFIELGSKIATSKGGSADLSGGTGGGSGGKGRFRYDGFVVTTNTPTATNAGTTFVGPTMDTLSYAQSSKFTLTGTFDGTSPLRVYWRSDAPASNWTPLSNPTTNGRNWSLDVSLPSGSISGNYYFAVLQQTGTTLNDGANDAEPVWVFSQAGANIVSVDLIPKIKVVNAHNFGSLTCETSESDTVWVYNEGDAILTVTPSMGGTNAGDFTILPPNNTTFSVDPGDSVALEIRFTPATFGARTATMSLANNDPRPGKNPTIVALSGEKKRSEASLDNNVLQFGKVCIGQTRTLQVTLTYNGDDNDKLNGVPIVMGANAGHFSVVQPTSSDLSLTAPTDTKTIAVRFAPQTGGAFVDSVQVSVGQCNLLLTIRLTGEGVDTRAAISPSPVDLGSVLLNNPSAPQSVTFTNTGTSAGPITSIYISPPNPAFALPLGLIGTTLNPGKSVSGNIVFTPTTLDPYDGQLCVVVGDVCPDTFCVPLKARVVNLKLVLSRDHITLVSDTCQDPPPAVLDTVRLINIGGVGVNVLDVKSKNGLVTTTGAVGPLPAGTPATITVRWLPGSNATDELTITTDASDPAQQSFTVTVTLVRQTSQIKAIGKDGSDPALPLDFGDVNGCQVPVADTLFLRNSGTVDETVQGDFIRKAENNNAFTLKTPSPYSLPKGGADIPIIVVFDPSAIGTYHDTLVFVTGLCNHVVRVAVSATRTDPLYDTTGITFVKTNLGYPRSGTARLKNGGTTSLTVSSAFISPASGTPFVIASSNLPADLAPGTEATVDVSFTPPAEQTYNAQLCFVITAPCPDTICVDLTGEGIRSSVLVEPNPVMFGNRVYCEDTAVRTLMIRNVGSGPLLVQQINMGGADIGLFDQITQLSLPQSIPAGNKIIIDYKFVPSRANSPGPKSATVLVLTDDQQQPAITVTLEGTVIKSLTPSSPVALGLVVVGTSKDQKITLTNNSPTTTVTIDSISAPDPYKVLTPIPKTLAPGESQDITVRFTPTDSGSFTRSLVIYQSEPCVDSSTVELRGAGRVLLLGTTEIAVPDTARGKPGQRIAVPILLRTAQNLPESEATTLTGTVRFDKSLLFPTGVRSKDGALIAKPTTGSATTEGRMVSSVIDGNDRVVTFEITNTPVPASAPDTLGFLDATVMLGSTLSTPITFDTVFWSDGNAIATARNGTFALEGYCQEGGDRLLKVNGTFGIRSVTPNPFNPATEIVFETVEDGPTSLVIHDLQGRTVETLVDRERLPIQAHARTWDAGRFPSGIYYAILTTPTQRSVYRLVLVK